MRKPELLGLEVITPDGRGSILALHYGVVEVHLNSIEREQKMKGRKGFGELHYKYPYEEVEIIKGRYNFKEK